MKKGQWTKTDSLTDSDISVIIDINSEIFWFWEGPQSTARDRYNARQILGQLREKYISYKFKRINKEASEYVRDELEALQIYALAKKKSDKRNQLKNLANIIHFISLMNSFFNIIIIILLIGVLVQSQSIFPYIFFNQINFNFTLEICSLILILSLIILILSAIYMGISRNRFLLVISIIGCCFNFISLFMLRIWDELLIVISSGQHYLIQIDAIFFFIFSIDIFLILSISCCLIVGIMGFMNVKYFIKRFEKEI
ncbi:MAG: hypothetical protein ACFFBP_01680 [Promethearchaeota archaeon]